MPTSGSDLHGSDGWRDWCHMGTLRSRGAAFLTPPHDWGSEISCCPRDPDGHLVEISQLKAS